jgi:hypothetical protein
MAKPSIPREGLFAFFPVAVVSEAQAVCSTHRCDRQNDNGPRVRFSVLLGQEPEVEVALLAEMSERLGG